jgi:hypothetical protein
MGEMDGHIFPIVWVPAENLSRGEETMKARLMLVGVVLLGILLATSGVIQAQPTSAGENDPDHGTPMPPTGQEARYVLPYYTSQTLLEGAQSVTAVNVYN